RLSPMLRPARDHEWKPMGWDYSVKKSNDKSCDKDCYKNNVIHFGEVGSRTTNFTQRCETQISDRIGNAPKLQRIVQSEFRRTAYCHYESRFSVERSRWCCHKAKSEIRISNAPKVQTIAAPEGKSHQ